MGSLQPAKAARSTCGRAGSSGGRHQVLRLVNLRPPRPWVHPQVDFDAMKRDIQALEAACAATGSPIVFGHNDLLAGNILVLQVGAVMGSGGSRFVLAPAWAQSPRST